MGHGFGLRTALGAVLIGATLALGACAGGVGGNDVPRSRAGQIARTDTGVVIASRAVNIEGTKSGLGAGAGAVIGGAAGSELGGDDTGRIVGAVAGAVLGGIVGAAAEEGATRQTGFEYTIRLDRNGELISIVQGADIALPNGTPVFIQYGNPARVTPQNANIGY